MKKLFLICTILTILNFNSFSQNPQEIANKGFELIEQNNYEEATKVFKNLIALAPTNYGGYNFVGLCYSQGIEYDSTIFYLKKSIELNSANFKNSREMTISRLIRTYLQKMDFKSAFELAYNSLKEFPNNNNLKTDLKDVCLWSYNINFEGFDKTYISRKPKDFYEVTSVSQEYLVLRHLRINDLKLNLITQKLDGENNSDILVCGYNNGKDTINLIFKIKWDMNKEFGGKLFSNPEKESENKNNYIWDRIGAKLINEPKLALIEEIEKIIAK